ncbi:hypothetical protein D3C77_732000 [compost metagenome]
MILEERHIIIEPDPFGRRNGGHAPFEEAQSSRINERIRDHQNDEQNSWQSKDPLQMAVNPIHDHFADFLSYLHA